MNVNSHAKIASVLHHHLKTNMGVDLPRKAFITSNCRPDFSLKYKQIPHYKSFMYEAFKDLIEELCVCEKSKLNAYYIADRLGVICHFLCDFFCYAHTPAFKGNLKEHFKYEQTLNRYIKFRTLTLKNFNFLSDQGTASDINDIFDNLEHCFKEYSECISSPAVDTVFALKACETVVVPLMDILVFKCQLSLRRLVLKSA